MAALELVAIGALYNHRELKSSRIWFASFLGGWLKRGYVTRVLKTPLYFCWLQRLLRGNTWKYRQMSSAENVCFVQTIQISAFSKWGQMLLLCGGSSLRTPTHCYQPGLKLQGGFVLEGCVWMRSLFWWGQCVHSALLRCEHCSWLGSRSHLHTHTTCSLACICLLSPPHLKVG